MRKQGLQHFKDSLKNFETARIQILIGVTQQLTSTGKPKSQF